MPFDHLSEEDKDKTLAWLETNVLNHPEHGKAVKKILKKVDPRVNFPEVDLEEAVDAKTKAQEEKIDKFLAEQKEKENKAYWSEKKSAALRDGLIKPEEVEDFHKWMVEEHLGNYERAAKMWHDEKHKSAEPTNYQERTSMQLPNNEGLFANPIKFARDEAYKFINERNRGH
jgi:hypothetical protein